MYQFVALKLGESAFAYGFYYVMGGCLIPLIVSPPVAPPSLLSGGSRPA